jgi:radical SAM protein with 4Fe4S-binding SPASM domain
MVTAAWGGREKARAGERTSVYLRLGFGFCAAGSSRAYYTLDTAGNVRPCNHTPTILGNVWTEPFGEIIDATRLADFVAAVPDCCVPCARRDECQGGCKASAQVCYGDLRKSRFCASIV